jgi:hypothetical protein
MNWLKNLFGSISRYFRSGAAAKQVSTALEFVGRALPFVVQAADIIVALTPTPADDAIWLEMKERYPEVFDGTRHEGTALRRAGLQIAASELKKRYPELNTDVAIAAAQLAWIDYRNLPK